MSSTSRRPARPASLPRRTGRQLRRALAARHEPLARPLDRSRARAWLLAALGAVLAVALAAGGALLLYRDTASRAAAERARLHQVDAVIHSAPDHAAPAGSRYAGGYSNRADVEAAWTGPDGSRHVGTLQATRTALTGTRIPIWIDQAGNASAPPVERITIALSAACTGSGALVVLLAALTIALRLRLRALDRRAEGAWGDSWARLEPLWSGRAGHRHED
ncbi:Rv1733c family protein [Streptomyces sp. 1331.2]|uniref:Rv1733c family protein n=1 Tax=Streptomyces sp. 1331.2 TaxID=1938835 RepID=UPI000BDA050D|nr:hypothetical protein [Streptomyces sp. 1331.2]SOB85392.1 hypothetical protein SAMN06272789_5679 [Streptomyces sp. 1331.2]